MFCSPPQLMWDLTIHLHNQCRISQSTFTTNVGSHNPPSQPMWDLTIHLHNQRGISQSTFTTNVGSHNPPSQPMWDLTIHLHNQCGTIHPSLGCQTSSLAHHSVSSSNTICNSLSSPLADIIRFGPLRIVVSLTILKRVC